MNVYDLDQCWSGGQPNPLKSIMNLTTSCTQMKFNHTSEILALASDAIEKAVKLVSMLAVSRLFGERSVSGLLPFEQKTVL